MITHAQIKQVMLKNHCDWPTACSFLGQRGAAAKAAKKRQRTRRADLQRQADDQERRFQAMKQAQPGLY